jgi:hypothetical protein
VVSYGSNIIHMRLKDINLILWSGRSSRWTDRAPRRHRWTQEDHAGVLERAMLKELGEMTLRVSSTDCWHRILGPLGHWVTYPRLSPFYKFGKKLLADWASGILLLSDSWWVYQSMRFFFYIHLILYFKNIFLIYFKIKNTF